MKEKKATAGAILIAAVFIAGAVFYTARAAKPNPHKYDVFAQCLTERGAVMYGASWCPHCQAEKAAFANSFQYIRYVECVTDPALCSGKGVDAYPSWLVGTTSKIEGFDQNSFAALAKATGCVLPK